MYPFARMAGVLWKARGEPRVSPLKRTTCTFRCHPWDIDQFFEMNNGRQLTLYDLGRFDLAVKIGLWDVLKREGWGLVVAGGSVRFRKRIRMFDKIIMHTQLVGLDERWTYIQQSMEVAGVPCSSFLVRVAATEKGRAVKTQKVMEALGLADIVLEPEDWVAAWIKADAQRPWPPEFHEANTTTPPSS